MATLAGNEHYPSRGKRKLIFKSTVGLRVVMVPCGVVFCFLFFQPILVYWKVVGNTFVGKLGEVSKNAKGG